MTTMVLDLNYDYNAGLVQSNGSCKESQDINDEIKELRCYFTNANSIGTSIREVQEELDDLFKECGEDNWDGYNASGISKDIKDMAERFANCFLFLNIPKPEIIPEPTGAIAFEWEVSKGNSFIASINSIGQIAYVGFFGVNRSKGLETFNDEIPDSILNNLKRLYSISGS